MCAAVNVSYRTFQPGHDGDVIGLRFFKPADAHSAAVPILYLPGRFANSDILFNDPALDMRMDLASLGHPVASMDYRCHFLEADAPSAEERYQTWDLTTFVEDVRRAIGFALREFQAQRIVLTGHSMGATLAYLAALKSPCPEIAALIALDGGLVTPPGARTDFCLSTALDEAAAAGPIENGGPLRLLLQQLHGGSSTQGLRDLVTRLQPASGKLTSRLDNPEALAMIALLLASYDWRWPRRVTVEARGVSFAQHHSTLDWLDPAKKLDTPVLAVVAKERGPLHAARVIHSAQTRCTGTPDILELPKLAHLDVVATPDLRRRVTRPVANWLKTI